MSSILLEFFGLCNKIKFIDVSINFQGASPTKSEVTELGKFILASLFFVIGTMVEFAIVLFVKQIREERMEQTLDHQRKSAKNICPTTPAGRNVVNVSPENICKDYKGFRIPNYEKDKEALFRKASAITKKIDRLSIILFSVAYIIFNCIYFNY